MGKLKLKLKVYIDKYGNQYLEGAKNQLFPLYKLSNNVYELNLITELPVGAMTVSFEKADGTITQAYPMALVGNELVGEEYWNVYNTLIDDDVLNVSEKVGRNMLGISFHYGDGSATLNSEPIYVKCSYSINGQLPQLSGSDYEGIVSEVITTILETNKDKVRYTTFLPLIVDDESNDNYNVGFVYVLDGKYTEISEVPSTPTPNVAYKWKGENLNENEPYFVTDKYYKWDESNARYEELVDFENTVGNGYVINSNQQFELIFYGRNTIRNIERDIDNLEDKDTVIERNIEEINSKNAEQDESIASLSQTDLTHNLQIQANSNKINQVEQALNDYKTSNDEINNTQNEKIDDVIEQANNINDDLQQHKQDFETFKNTNSQAITNMGVSSVNTSKSYTDGKVAVLEEKKINKDFTDINNIGSLGDNDYFVINRSGTSYKVSVAILKQIFGSTDTEQVVEHYKGNFASLEELNRIVGQSGDYAFVYTRLSETDTTFVMYIWNSQDGAWEETSTSQYVLSSDYEEYKDQILNGGITVKRAKDYDETDGTIQAKFNELINIITNINAVKVIDGPTLEDMEYEEGRLYYVNESSDSFTKNTMYYGKENGGIMKINASEVSLEPAILTFTMAGANPVEVGNTTNLTNYTMTLKKYAQFSKIKITSGSATIVDNITPNPSIASSINYTLNNTSIGQKTITATGTLTSGGTKTKNLNYQVYGRQYYGGSTDETLTSESGTALFGQILGSTDNIETFLQQSRVSSLSISLGDTPTYLYFVIPSHMTINSIVSGPLSFPFIQQDNINITNYYNASVACKVYRSANKVYGDINLIIS